MMTVRQIEKLWDAHAFRKLLGEMLAGRPEASVRLESEFTGHLPAAAMALVRLEELSQAHVALYGRLLRMILSAQESDGGWGDPLTTAVCLRALLGCQGQGASINRGMAYLALLQKTEGIWPKDPIRRLSADGFTSAFILLALGQDDRFRGAVRFNDALDWFDTNAHNLDDETRTLWDYASIRCRNRRMMMVAQEVFSWS